MNMKDYEYLEKKFFEKIDRNVPHRYENFKFILLWKIFLKMRTQGINMNMKKYEYVEKIFFEKIDSTVPYRYANL